MKLTSVLPQIKTDNKVRSKRTEGDSAAKTAVGGTPVSADRVELSTGSQDVRKAREILRQTPDVRLDKVEALKEQIASGEYVVDPHRIADNMLLNLLSESVN